METKKLKLFDFSKYMKNHILLKFLYLGWDRHGFAVQEDTNNTIEAILFEALLKTKLIECRETSNYHRCGRTDKGVSAFTQVISITVRSAFKKENINNENEKVITEVELNYPKILNSVLPIDVRIIAWSHVNEEFSARFNCISRTYKYFFPMGNLDIDAMRKASSYLIGEHDFRNLCKMDVGNGVVNFIRKITSFTIKEINSSVTTDKDLQEELNQQIDVLKDSQEELNQQNDVLNSINKGYSMYVATIEGTAFLWHQIRAIMTVLFLVAEKKESPEIVSQLLNVENTPRKPQYSLASELGLNLYDAQYDNVDWQYDHENLQKVISQLQQLWTQYAIKSSMIECMLRDLSQTLSEENGDLQLLKMCSNQAKACVNEPKVYRPLFTRPTCESLEERVDHYIKKRRLEESVREKMKKLEENKQEK